MSPIKATSLEERRLLQKRGEERQAREYAATLRKSEEEEVATYLSMCPMFTTGLLELNEGNFISLMLRTRQFMLKRWIDMRRGESAIAFNLRAKMEWGYK